jgi:predicted DNA-binding protein (MmcQ/YjbR family)
MDIDAIREHCLSFPHASEKVQWGSALCFKVDGKLFAVAALDVSPTCLSFKCSPESFVELCERPNVIPAPYLARAQWVALETPNALGNDELRELLCEAYRLVWERLPKKRQEALAGGAAKSAKKAAKSAKRVRPTGATKRKTLGRRG